MAITHEMIVRIESFIRREETSGSGGGTGTTWPGSDVEKQRLFMLQVM